MKRMQVFTLLLLSVSFILAASTRASAQSSSSTPLAIDATASGDQSSSSSTVSTLPFSTSQPNELLLAFVSSGSNSTASNNVTSIGGGGLIWEFVTRANNQLGGAEIWRAFTPSPLSNVSVSAALAQSAAASITVIAFSGVDTSGTNGSGAVGASAAVSGASGAPAGSLVTTRNNSWVFAVGNDWDNALGRTLGANQTMVHQYLSSVRDTLWVQRQNTVTASSGTTVMMNDTAPTTDRFNFALIEVLPAAITAPDFSLSVTPSSQSVQAGANTTYSVDVSAQNGYSGTADLTVTGLPSSATGVFSPTSISGSATSQLTISSSTSLPSGNYSFTLTATSGSLVHSVDLTLVVNAGPDFTLAVTPAAQSISPGGATTLTTTITAQNGYSGTADLTTSGLPSGATANFSPASVLGAGTSQLTINSTASTPTGSYPLTITATSGSLIHSATATLVLSTTTTNQLQIDTVASHSRSAALLSISTGMFSTNQSNEVLLAFICAGSGGTAGNTVTALSGAGLSWQSVTRSNAQLDDAEIWRAFAPLPLTGVSVRATLSQSAAASITVVALSGADTSDTNASSAIGATGSFSSASGAPTGSLVTTRDNSWVFGVGADWDNAISRTLGPDQTLVYQYLSSVNDTFWIQRQNGITPNAGTTVTMNDVAPTGDRYDLALVEVLPASSSGGNTTLNLSSSPTSQTVQPGSSATYTVSVAGPSGYTGTANLSVSGLPSGATGTFNSASITGSGSSQLTVTTTGSTPAGSYPLTISANSAGLIKTITVTLTVGSNPDFTVSASPSSQSVQAGSNTTYNVTTAAQNGYSGTANLTVSGLPTGAAAAFNPASVNGSGTAQLNVSTTASTPLGSYPLTITATSGTLSHTSGVTLNVTASPDFTLSASPASQSVQPGSSTAYSLSVAAQNGYSGTATFNVSGLPTGATASFNPTSISGSGSTQMAVNTTSSTPIGSYPLTVTATSGSLSHTVGVTLAVTASPDFTLTVNPASSSVQAGQNTTYAVTISGQSGYSGTASLNVSGLPSGATGAFSPATVTGSGSSQLTIITTSSTAAGTYPLTITVTSGSLTHTIGASLTVTTATVQHSVSLSWTDGDSGIASYKVYRATQSGGPYTLVSTSAVATTSWVDNNVLAGTTYYYVVTAVNTSGVESTYSTEASAIVPTP